MSSRIRGVLKWFSPSSGYGHILGEDGRQYIVHRKSLQKGYLPVIGDAVSFVTRPVRAGLLADGVSSAGVASAELDFNLTSTSASVNLEVGTDSSAQPVPPDGPPIGGTAEIRPAPAATSTSDLAAEVTSKSVQTPALSDDAVPPGLPAAATDPSKPLRRKASGPSRADQDLAQAVLYQTQGDERKARDAFERGMLFDPPSVQLITAYVAFERNRGQTDAARRILERGLQYSSTGTRARSHLLAAFGHLELKSRRYIEAIGHLQNSIDLADASANTGQQYRYLALAHARIEDPRHAELAWEAVKKAIGRKIRFAREEELELLPVFFGGSFGRLGALLRFLDALDFRVVAVGERVDRGFVYEPPDMLTLVVRAESSIYQTAYDLADDIVLVLHTGAESHYQEVERAEATYSDYRRRANVHPNTLILVVDDVQRLRQQLLRRAERPGKPIIIPLDDRLFARALADPGVASTEFQRVLQDWLFQVDRFKSNQPVSGRNFFGRERLIGDLEAQIDDRSSVGVFGLRKIGKTSILRQLIPRRLVDVVAYVDMQALPPGVASIDFVLWLIGDSLAKDALSKYGPQAGSGLTLFGVHESFPGGSLGAAFDSDLNRLAGAIRTSAAAVRPKIVVMLDEIERFFPGPSRPGGLPGFDEFFGYLRGKTQQSEWFVSIVAGANARIVEEPQWMGVDNPVFKFYQAVYVPPLEAAESREMVQTLGRGMGLTFSEDAERLINSETGCHPFVVRQLCSLLFRSYPERPLHVTENLVADVTPRFELEEDATFREMVDRLSRQFPEELRVIEYLAAHPGATLEDLRLRYPTKLPRVLSHLVGYSLVSRNKREEYSVAFPMLRRWLLANTGTTGDA